jgi:hypothetical protein
MVDEEKIPEAGQRISFPENERLGDFDARLAGKQF